ncbi:MAG: protein TolQ [Chromatiales bacterium]|jgi:biopolymer transport protein TolQ|nr:protein TolQ [Chromatiales bacterium]MDX9766477.1 protein TolQ [Ectothiorhodospiraceae bacterium]
MSFVALITQASLVVQVVMAILVLASVISWTLIFLKWRVLREARGAASEFEERFWSGIDLVQLYEGIRRKTELSGLEHIFSAGFKEYVRARKMQRAGMTVAETAQRSMRVAMSREIDGLESYLSFLATVGSVSPYVGLFGTVWGIMHAFIGLADAQQATLAMVAPGIAEALVATALGLFAAIPAVVAFNRYVDDVDRLVTRYDNFTEEFTTLLQRQAQGQARESEA